MAAGVSYRTTASSFAPTEAQGLYGNITEAVQAIYHEASRLKGDTSERLIGLLERRLDASYTAPSSC